ncbi:hypothetical protein [Leptolyngbya sp. BL0902]|uniref:hypothetical protein n=1 Tax=Leptolyngbya sp. BL0902 TaxID=1115757 RepID=UPI001CED1B97|nr:hypothetical protein [Leptolyngbya sp. BL0902]
MLIGSGIAWGVVSLLFSLLFVPSGGNEPAEWFVLGINLLETGAFLIASLLCFRNWRSPQIVSGRTVWFWIGLGLMMYALGNIFFFLWGNLWGLDPVVSFADFFYILCYVFLSVGMFQAVLPRRLNLELSQWLIVLGIGLGGILLSVFVSLQAANAETLPTASTTPNAYLLAQAPAVPEVAPEAIPGEPVPATAPAVDPPPSAPSWAVAIDNLLEPFEGIVKLLYLLGDIVLLIIAGTLLVAFWGGRFSQSWKLIAVASFFLYVADMFFLYAGSTDTYLEGSAVWEVFWTLAAVFFWLGAVVEHAVSVNSRRSSRRRRG